MNALSCQRSGFGENHVSGCWLYSDGTVSPLRGRRDSGENASDRAPPAGLTAPAWGGLLPARRAADELGPAGVGRRPQRRPRGTERAGGGARRPPPTPSLGRAGTSAERDCGPPPGPEPPTAATDLGWACPPSRPPWSSAGRRPGSPASWDPERLSRSAITQHLARFRSAALPLPPRKYGGSAARAAARGGGDRGGGRAEAGAGAGPRGAGRGRTLRSGGKSARPSSHRGWVP